MSETDEWKPRMIDALWLQGIVNMLKPNGEWLAPATGVVFKKTGEKELTLKLVVSTQSRVAEVDEVVEKTIKVGEND